MERHRHFGNLHRYRGNWNAIVILETRSAIEESGIKSYRTHCYRGSSRDRRSFRYL